MDIESLERAGSACLAAPNEISNQDRAIAEEMFKKLKDGHFPIRDLLEALHQTNHQFVLYQLSQAISETMLHRWIYLTAEEVQTTFKRILDFVSQNESLTNYVISDLLRTIAITIKRGTIDKKIGEDEVLCQLIQNMVTSQNLRIQSLGCQFIYLITEQFSTTWRSAHLSISWDFHMRAKAEFEKSTLYNFLKMTTETLTALIQQPDMLQNEFYKGLCAKFLEIAELIFQWNFSAKIYRRYFITAQSTAFRPPSDWVEHVTKEEFLMLFFQLHLTVRNDVDLALKSLNCLVQLASFSGEIMTANATFGQSYMQQYVTSLLQLVQAGILEHETNGIAMIINRCFVHRPIQQIIRLTEDARARFFAFIYEFMDQLMKQAITKALANDDHADHTSLLTLMEAWAIMLRGRWRTGLPQPVQETIEQSLLRAPTIELVKTFICCFQAPDFGIRPYVPDEEERNEDDEENDDRELFKNLLQHFYNFATFTVTTTVPAAADLIKQKVNFLKSLLDPENPLLVEYKNTPMEQRGNTNFSKQMNVWQEDMHWAMLFVANSVISEDMDGTCSMAGEILDVSSDLAERRGVPFSEELKVGFLTECMRDPMGDIPIESPDIDPFIILLGHILAWNVLENQMIRNVELRDFVSAETMRSSVHCLRRFINAASCIPEDSQDRTSPLLYPNEVLSENLVHFIMDKVFNILENYTNEKRLCVDAVDLLTALLDSRAEFLSRGDLLYSYLAKLDVTKLPSRTKLTTALVQIAVQTENEEIQQRMYERILRPMMEQFEALTNQPSNSQIDSSMVDYIQCFDGVALAGGIYTANALADFLNPLIQLCIPLMYSRPDSQPVITAVLQLISNTTLKILLYIEDQEKVNTFTNSLAEIIRGYAITQKTHFTQRQVDEEEKATDLIVFMDIMSNILSKDILQGGPDNITEGARVVVISLDMLLSVMNENLLKIPELANKFYRLIVYLVEYSPETLTAMSEQLLVTIFLLLQYGMESTFGTEIASIACEALTEIAAYLVRYPSRRNQVMTENLHRLLKLTFECCLYFSSDNSLFTEATAALFGLICFDKAKFEELITSLLNDPANQPHAEQLQQSFRKLLPDNKEPAPDRQARMEFRRRMEQILDEISGILTIP